MKDLVSLEVLSVLLSIIQIDNATNVANNAESNEDDNVKYKNKIRLPLIE